MPVSLTVDVEGVQETLNGVRQIRQELRKEANGEIRQAAKLVAEELVGALRASAGSSGVPVAPLVASTAKVKSDRFPTVVIGGSKRVGSRKTAASALVWGSEHGPRGEVNHFAVPPNGGGYWIAPAVQRFEASRAVPAFTHAIEAIIARYGLED